MRCQRCGRKIKFIKTEAKTYVVNFNPIYFIPDDNGKVYIMSNGKMMTGRATQDGILGYTLHNC